MPKKAIHISDVAWESFNDSRLGPVRWKNLLSMDTCGCREFLLGYAELDPACVLPLHTHAHAQCNYVLSGRVWSRLGKRRIELEPDSADFVSWQYWEPSKGSKGMLWKKYIVDKSRHMANNVKQI